MIFNIEKCYLRQLSLALTETSTILCTTLNENKRFEAGPDGQWTLNAFNSVEHEFYAVKEYTFCIADHTSGIYIYL